MADYYPLRIAATDFATIKGVCKQYQAIVKNPRKDAGGDVPGYEDRYMVWTPTQGDDNGTAWGNFISADMNWIAEHKSPETENKIFVEKAKGEEGKRRITYWRETPATPFRFIGVYELDLALTEICGVRVYKRVSDTLPALEIIN